MFSADASDANVSVAPSARRVRLVQIAPRAI